MESIFKLGILLSVVDKVTGPASNMGKGMDSLKGKVASLGPAFDKFKTYGLRVATAGALILHMLSGTVMATVDTQKALGELSSVGIQDLGTLERAGREFSSQWSGTTKAQFIGAAYDIKSGISSLTDEGVAEFTKLAALTGKATKSTTAEMTSLFATGYGIYKDMYGNLTDMQFGEVFSAGIAASVKNFKTTGSGMAQAISSLGASATVAKRPMEEQLAVLGMLQATLSGSEAGTAYKAVIRDVAAAGEKLGLNFYDANDNLKGLPEILGMIHNKFGDLTGVEGDIIKNAFTDESYKAVSQLYSQIGALTDNTRSLAAAMRTGTGFTEQMAAAMNQDIGAGIDLLGQRFHNLVEAIGKQLIPILSPLFSWIGRGIMRLTEFAENHGTLTRVFVVSLGVIASLAFVLGSLAAILGVIGLMSPNVVSGIGLVTKGFATLKANVLGMIPVMRRWLIWQSWSIKTFLYQQGGIKGLASSINKNMLPAIWSWVRNLVSGLLPAIGAAATAVWGFTVALLANPITWIVIGIAALVAGLVLLYKHCEPVRKVIIAVGRAFKTAGEFALLFLGVLVGGLVTGLKAILTIATNPIEFIGFLLDMTKQAIGGALDWIKGMIPMFLEAGVKLWGALVSGIKAQIMEPVEVVKGGLSKLRNLLPFSDAKEGPLSALTLSGKRIMQTLGSGIQQAAPELRMITQGALAGLTAASIIATPVIKSPGIKDLAAKAVWEGQEIEKPGIPDLSGRISWLKSGQDVRQRTAGGAGQAMGAKSITIQNLNVSLPNVADAESFVDQLRRIVEGYDA